MLLFLVNSGLTADLDNHPSVSFLQLTTTDAASCSGEFPSVSHSFCKTSSLLALSNRGKEIAVCLAFLREGHITHVCKKQRQDVVYVLLKCKAALPSRMEDDTCAKNRRDSCSHDKGCTKTSKRSLLHGPDNIPAHFLHCSGTVL